MKKENVKRFWNEHKKTITKAVILVTVPTVVVVGFVVINKILDKKTNKIFDKLEDSIKDEA